jgi:RNA 2',3'-cyclic 3'-phosphodiesterase
MSSGTWRCFVAVPIPDALRRALLPERDTWIADPDVPRLRWTDPASWHLTLAFLGAVPSDDVPALADRVGAVAGRHRAHRVGTGGLGAFPHPRRAGVVWYGVEPDAALGALAADLAQDLSLDVGDPFQPHLTLARARRGGVDVRAWLSRFGGSAPAGQLPVQQIDLMRSHLGSGPARYERLATFLLGRDA